VYQFLYFTLLKFISLMFFLLLLSIINNEIVLDASNQINAEEVI
jgi:hypothetical protein